MRMFSLMLNNLKNIWQAADPAAGGKHESDKRWNLGGMFYESDSGPD